VYFYTLINLIVILINRSRLLCIDLNSSKYYTNSIALLGRYYR